MTIKNYCNDIVFDFLILYYRFNLFQNREYMNCQLYVFQTKIFRATDFQSKYTIGDRIQKVNMIFF